MIQMNQINPSRQSRAAILQGRFLVSPDMLAGDFPITQNRCSGAC
jgi:hypothetical protein